MRGVNMLKQAWHKNNSLLYTDYVKEFVHVSDTLPISTAVMRAGFEGHRCW